MLTSLPHIGFGSGSQVLRARPAADPRLPHPSWRRVSQPSPGDGTAAIRSAGDFWSRLGL